MTCIIAKIHGGKVHMMADRMGSNGFTKESYPLIKKVFKNGDFLLGCTTSFRMIQLLHYSWEPPKMSLDLSDDTYIFKNVVNSIMKCFKDNEFGHKKDVEFEAGNFLLGWKGRLFEVQPNMSLLESGDFASVGSGSYHAVASMSTLSQLGQLANDVEGCMALALRVAARRTTSVSEEYDYLVES